MNRYEFLMLIWKITNKYSHHITTELMSINIADQYVKNGYYYNNNLAYVSTIIAVKINEECHGFKSIKSASRILNDKSIFELEHDIIMNVTIESNFVNQLSNISIILGINQFSYSFIFLLRYLEWCDVLNFNLFTIILAIKLLIKNKKLTIYHGIKNIKVYTIFYDLSELYDINMYNLIDLYKNIKTLQ